LLPTANQNEEKSGQYLARRGNRGYKRKRNKREAKKRPKIVYKFHQNTGHLVFSILGKKTGTHVQTKKGEGGEKGERLGNR